MVRNDSGHYEHTAAVIYVLLALLSISAAASAAPTLTAHTHVDRFGRNIAAVKPMPTMTTFLLIAL